MATMRRSGNSAAATVLNHLPYRQCARSAPGFVHRLASKRSLINPSKLWTILVCPRSYPDAQSTDAIGGGLPRRNHFPGPTKTSGNRWQVPMIRRIKGGDHGNVHPQFDLPRVFENGGCWHGERWWNTTMTEIVTALLALLSASVF